METDHTETTIHETSLKTNPGAIVGLDETEIDGAKVYTFTVTVNDHDARTVEFGCGLLIKDAFPDHEGIVTLPTGCIDAGRTLTGKSAGAPRFTDQNGLPARFPALGSRVRLSGVLTPVRHGDRGHIVFAVREVIIVPDRTLARRRKR